MNMLLNKWAIKLRKWDNRTKVRQPMVWMYRFCFWLGAFQTMVLLLVWSSSFFLLPFNVLSLKRSIQFGYFTAIRNYPYESFGHNCARAVIASEDMRFIHHHGFDFEAIEAAEKRNEQRRKQGKGLIGASTISQQVAKNAFLWPQRSLFRKFLEVYTTVLIESYWSKKTILKYYLCLAETGKQLYGFESAAKYYYRKSASQLNSREAASIAAILPLPLKWNPLQPTNQVKRRMLKIERRMIYAELP
jgi:monofunctional biosynthetic peptidoglycan transglycosylase